MRLTPDQFGRFTPGEFSAALRGIEQNERAEARRIAWAVAWLVNTSGNVKKPVTIETILGEKSESEVNESPTRGMSPKEQLEYCKSQFGVK